MLFGKLIHINYFIYYLTFICSLTVFFSYFVNLIISFRFQGSPSAHLFAKPTIIGRLARFTLEVYSTMVKYLLVFFLSSSYSADINCTNFHAIEQTI